MTRQHVAAVIFTAALVVAAPASAQGPDPNPGGVTLAGGIDFVNAYHFRGIPQDESGVIMWPYGDLGFALFSGNGGLKSVGVNVGIWNSLHTGSRGLDNGTNGKLWYESDFYTTLGLGFGGGTSVGMTYTAYTSPNGLFGTVRELAFKFAVDDSGYLGAAAVKPYVLVARELSGQADGGLEEGTYLELGIVPGFAISRASVAVPVKVGLSLGDYYESFEGDEKFGFFSLAGVVTVPFTSAPTRLGTWNVHGGAEYLRLGESNRSLGVNQLVGSIGIGFSY
jgi:hypothetical protein